MLLDYSSPGLASIQIITYPEWVAEATPLQPNQIKDTTYLTGDPGGGNVLYLEGSVGPDL